MNEKFETNFNVNNDTHEKVLEDHAYKVFASRKNWVESEALAQLRHVSGLPGMVAVYAMADIHPGKGGPVGAAMFAKDTIYPALIGSDVGCGMRFSMLEKHIGKVHLDRWEKRLTARTPVTFSREFVEERMALAQVAKTDFDDAMGTIGHGNHFAELQVVKKIFDQELFESLGLDRRAVYLTVHSGSRSYGNAILRSFTDRFGATGIGRGDAAFDEYLNEHDNALKWGRLNRSLIAERLLEKLPAGERLILDLPHNFLESLGDGAWIHRKGAAPANRGPVIIPGSRGSATYLVMPLDECAQMGYSIAHGAGRKYNRIRTRQKAKSRFTRKELKRLPGGARLVTNDQDSVFEESPDGYKNIETIIADIEEFGMAAPIASFEPVLTYKVNPKMEKKKSSFFQRRDYEENASL